MTEQLLRVGLVGAGGIAREAHLPAWALERRAAVTWVVDARDGAARSAAAEWAIERWSGDYRDLLDSGAIDAVDICLPAGLHAAVSAEFLSQGIPVLVEKPVAMNMSELESLRQARNSSGATFMVAENWPYSSAYKIVQDIIQGGDRTVLLLQARHETAVRLPAPGPEPADKSRLGYTMAAGIHSLNLARHVAGEFESLVGFADPAFGSTGIDTMSVLASRFESGALGSFSFTGVSRHRGERRLWFQVHCDDGVVEFDIWHGWVRSTFAGVETLVQPEDASPGFAEEIAHFVDCVLDSSTPVTSLEDQERTLAAVLAAYSALSAHDAAPDPSPVS